MALDSFIKIILLSVINGFNILYLQGKMFNTV